MRVDEPVKGADTASAEDLTYPRSLRRPMIDRGARRASPLRDGQSAPPTGSSGGDPLAQLARLIERDEAFGAAGRRGRSDPRGELSGRPDPSSHLDREGVPSVCPSDGPIGEPHDPHEHGDYDVTDYADELQDRRRGLRVFAALVGLALVGSASAMAYWAWFDEPRRSDEARVIGASIAPDKTASSQENSRVAGERSAETGGPTIAGDDKSADTTPAVPQAVPPVGILYGPGPAKVAALTSGAAPPSTPAAPAQNQPAESTEPAPAQPAAAATEPSGAQGGYVVQLSSQRSEAAAQTTSRALQTKHAGVLGDHQPFVRRSDLGERGVYYRVLTGPFSIGEAKQVCGDLKKSGADCVVQRN